MPDVPVPEIAISPDPFTREIALRSEDSSFSGSSPTWSEQAPLSLDWLGELLPSPLRFPLKNKEPKASEAYALEFDLAKETALASSKKQQNYGQNKIEALKPFDSTLKNEVNGQSINSHFI